MSSPLAAQSRVLDLDPRLAARLSGTPVLVTGGTGYIGQALVGALFQAGARVAVLTRSPERARGLWDGAAVELRQGDLEAPEGVAGACGGVALVFQSRQLLRRPGRGRTRSRGARPADR